MALAGSIIDASNNKVGVMIGFRMALRIHPQAFCRHAGSAAIARAFSGRQEGRGDDADAPTVRHGTSQ
jgi:hypothetical protein